jgi:hypothetical protein
VTPEQNARSAHACRLAHLDERAGHPAGPADIHQPGIAFGEMVLRCIVQDQTAHRADPHIHGTSYLRRADEPEQSPGLGRLVSSRVRLQGHAAGEHGRPVLGERQAETGADICGVRLDEAVEQPRRFG